MPFSFKPEITQTPNAQAQPLSPIPAPTMSLANRPNGEGKSIVQLVLMVLFGLSVLVAIGLFGYSYYLSSQIDAKKAKLNSYESQLGDLPIDQMRALSNRIKVINTLISMHPSVNAAFSIVENSVENPVTYKQFSLHYDSTAKAYRLDLAGYAPDYKGVAQQVDTLKRAPYSNYLGDISVSGLSPDDKGGVGFKVSMPIKIAGVLPEDLNLVESAPSTPAATSTATSTQEATSTPQP